MALSSLGLVVDRGSRSGKVRGCVGSGILGGVGHVLIIKRYLIFSLHYIPMTQTFTLVTNILYFSVTGKYGGQIFSMGIKMEGFISRASSVHDCLIAAWKALSSSAPYFLSLV